MAKPLVFRFNGTEVPFALEKVERSDLYGYIDTEVLDESGHRCQLATLAGDGRTIIGKGGTATALLSADGRWMERSELQPVDPLGTVLQPVPSSYAAPVSLEEFATIEDLLSHNIKSVYRVSPEGTDPGVLDELKKGTIFTFRYSFRGGVDADAGFLLASFEGIPFLLTGEPAKLEFVGFEESAAPSEQAEEPAEDDSMDFGMM
jgi:hypothetical protein